ncbi:MAG: phenylacetic acid degradation protein PaaN [Pseudomonadota bacterium]
MSSFFQTHEATLNLAMEAVRARGHYTPYPEAPSGRIYGETAKDDGAADFAAILNTTFPLDQPSAGDPVGAEASPYGFDLGITYPAAPADMLVAAAKAAGRTLAAAAVDDRAGVCLEILSRLNAQSFLMANAVMNTTGQAFIMAFQAGGPHAQDRGLEAVATAYMAMSTVPGAVRWEKPMGKNPPAVMDKTFRITPRGVGLIIGCATFPTWNSYPALFANLATGNASIVKPHPAAILPLALTVKIARDVLAEAGLDPNAVILAADTVERPVTMDFIGHDDVAMIDFTGSNAFGATVRAHARGRPVFTEEAGVNPVVILGTPSFKGMCNNLAMSLSLYSGQMCTAPQSLFVPAEGIDTDEGHKSFDEVGEGIARSLDKLLGDKDRAMAILGAIQNPATISRVEEAMKAGSVVRRSTPVEGAEKARTATPALIAVNASDEAWKEECFGPVAYLIRAEDAQAAIALAEQSVREKGAITASVYATDDALVDAAEEAFVRAGVALSVNLTGGILVNQSAAFSDFHVTGLNPAGTASLTDLAFIAPRFGVTGVRKMAA